MCGCGHLRALRASQRARSAPTPLQQDTIMMDKFIRRSVAGAALLMASPAAHAADMIRKAPPYPVSMSPMWSGAYVGFKRLRLGKFSRDHERGGSRHLF